MDSNLTIIWLCNSMGTDFRRCGEIDEEMKQKLNEMHVGRLIHILSHTMKRHNPAEVMENDDLTTMQKHVLKFILLETMHSRQSAPRRKNISPKRQRQSVWQCFCSELQRYEIQS